MTTFLKGLTMNKTTIDRKQELIDRARPHYHTKIYLPDKNEYISGLHCKPNGVTTYRINEVEPVVATTGIYELETEDAWLTVNRYNALVLNTRNMLIADIDF